MNDKELKVEGLKKVTLFLEAGAEAERMDLPVEPARFELVMGVKTSGYTPFEYELLGKKEGDTICMEITRGSAGVLFEHLDVPIPKKAEELPSCFLKATIVKIQNADTTEVVRAMARTVGDCGGSCCGNH